VGGGKKTENDRDDCTPEGLTKKSHGNSVPTSLKQKHPRNVHLRMRKKRQEGVGGKKGFQKRLGWGSDGKSQEEHRSGPLENRIDYPSIVRAEREGLATCPCEREKGRARSRFRRKNKKEQPEVIPGREGRGTWRVAFSG